MNQMSYSLTLVLRFVLQQAFKGKKSQTQPNYKYYKSKENFEFGVSTLKYKIKTRVPRQK